MTSNKRKYRRDTPPTEVEVNDGRPCQGGLLFDISVGGAAVTYPDEFGPTCGPLEVGQTLVLNIGNDAILPARIVRVFENGFASEFDFSLALRVPAQVSTDIRAINTLSEAKMSAMGHQQKS